MTTPTMDIYGNKKQIGLITSDNEHRLLQLESTASGLNVSQIYHVLVELMKTRTKAAQAQEIERPATVSEIEFFVLLVAFDSQLITEGELNHLLWNAQNLGGDFKDRIEPIFKLMATRLENLVESSKPGEQVDDDHPAKVAEEIKRNATV